ncbi:MAG: argininosuccinate lyase, partial [Actinomycetota bacterium]|nr:argininosuccinate lyase [Actinomycetota bacterium]
MAVGDRPTLLDATLTPVKGIAFALLYPRTPGILTGWEGLGRLKSFPGTPQWYPTATLGTSVQHLADQRGCTGIVLAEGPTAELAHYHVLAAAGAITPVTGR